MTAKWYAEYSVSECRWILCHVEASAPHDGYCLRRIFGRYKTLRGAEKAAAQFNRDGTTPTQAAAKGR